MGAWIETFGPATATAFLEVAPRVGAWIETFVQKNSFIFNKVAPRVGAWIETRPAGHRPLYAVLSHPVWVRGLKLCYG